MHEATGCHGTFPSPTYRQGGVGGNWLIILFCIQRLLLLTTSDPRMLTIADVKVNVLAFYDAERIREIIPQEPQS